MSDIDRTTFLSGANAEFIVQLYTRFLDDPNSVDDGWRRLLLVPAKNATGRAQHQERGGKPKNDLHVRSKVASGCGVNSQLRW